MRSYRNLGRGHSKTVVILIGVLLLAGCSYSDSFLIFNNSGEKIIVEYETLYECCADNAPVLSRIEDLKADKNNWRPPGDLKIEKRGRGMKFTIGLPARRVLKVASVINFQEDDDPSSQMNLGRLEIRGQEVKLIYTGNQILGHFEKAPAGFSIGPGNRNYALHFGE